MKKNKKRETILACVTNQRGSQRIIEKAAQTANEQNKILKVLSILPTHQLTQSDCETLDFLNTIAKNNNAEMTMHFSDSPAITALSFIKKKRISQVITGKPDESGNGFVEIIASVMPEVKISAIDQSGEMYDLVCLAQALDIATQRAYSQST